MAEGTHVSSVLHSALWERYKMADESSLNNVFSSHISRVRTKELLYHGNDTVPETIVTVKSPHKIRNVLNIFVVMICASRTL